ncbi:C1-like protein [Artemisia annua]|uniref:C1-like protein n=1 Tax=Artemisia annua TaxID=35608 RepID=A0A2U1KL60_ARTAN|nr:C1-like protein [Artemisia annua]
MAEENVDVQLLLSTPERNYLNETTSFVTTVISFGHEVFVTNLLGKTVGLYFMLSTNNESYDFTGTLVKVYNELKANDENFSGLPWLSLPFKDKKCEKLVRYFDLSDLPTLVIIFFFLKGPTLVIIGPDGKTLHPNVADAVGEHGAIAYPFTPDKFAELEKIEKAKQEAQTLESVLVSGDLDFVLGKDGAKIPVSDLVTFLHIGVPRVVLSLQSSLKHIMRSKPNMRHLKREYLSHLCKVKGIPSLAALGPTGKIITTETRDLIMLHGSEAFPFTVERMAEIETKSDMAKKDWPNKVTHGKEARKNLLKYGLIICLLPCAYYVIRSFRWSR